MMPAKCTIQAGIPGRPFRGYLYGPVGGMMPAECTIRASIPGRLFRGYFYGPVYGMMPAKRTIRAGLPRACAIAGDVATTAPFLWGQGRSAGGAGGVGEIGEQCMTRCRRRVFSAPASPRPHKTTPVPAGGSGPSRISPTRAGPAAFEHAHTLFCHNNRELPMRIKFCGTTSLADIQCGIDAGCDALGFIMGVRYQSSDFVTPEDAARLIRKLPPFIEPVAVTHLRETEDLIRLVRDSHCTTLQIQDTIEPAGIDAIRDALPHVKIIKAIHVTDESAITAGKLYEPHADALLLDSRTPEKIGGTGVPHDWKISARIVANSSIPVILAGGLTPENVCEAIRQVRPYGVDVHTGVKRDGIRDPEKTRAFVREARRALSNPGNGE